MDVAEGKIYTEEDYYNLPEGVHAELVDGVFYDQASPSRIHQGILGELLSEIRNYIKSKGGSCKVYPVLFAVKLMENRNTIVEPDITVICDRSKLTDRGCMGAPDWVIEIVSPGNSSHDYVRKLNLYEEAGVREYWIVDPKRESVFVYFFEESKFEVKTYTFKDKVRANIYEDLEIDFNDITQGELE